MSRHIFRNKNEEYVLKIKKFAAILLSMLSTATLDSTQGTKLPSTHTSSH